ncbi:hypothetical protein L370_02081 [Enterobacter sp. MGH 24]|nr:hypothetical protein L370_02081 [Enterobacter sp. MGH 24]
MNTDQLVALCLRHHALLLTSDSDMVSIAVVGSPAAELMEALRFATQKRIDIECWSAERMEKHRQLLSQSHLPVVSQTHSTVDILNHTLQQAINLRASDIHIEPMEHACQIRLRIDGVLCPQPPLAASLASLFSARLKVLGNLDISERRLPQDGQFTIELANARSRFELRRFPAAVARKLSCVFCIRFSRHSSQKRLA